MAKKTSRALRAEARAIEQEARDRRAVAETLLNMTQAVKAKGICEKINGKVERDACIKARKRAWNEEGWNGKKQDKKCSTVQVAKRRGSDKWDYNTKTYKLGTIIDHYDGTGDKKKGKRPGVRCLKPCDLIQKKHGTGTKLVRSTKRSKGRVHPMIAKWKKQGKTGQELRKLKREHLTKNLKKTPTENQINNHFKNITYVVGQCEKESDDDADKPKASPAADISPRRTRANPHGATRRSPRTAGKKK